MPSATHLPPPKLWRPLVAALAMLVAVAGVVLWNWSILDQREQRASQQRFDLDVQAIAEMVHARMQAYEMVLRGVASAFAGGENRVTYQRWNEVVELLRVQELYPGISSVAWVRHVHAAEMGAFLAEIHADGRPDFRVFPEGKREEYQVIKFIGPLNARTREVVGLDILTHNPQSRAIEQAKNSGQAALSEPMTLYADAAAGLIHQVGVTMYFPVYISGTPPDSTLIRRAMFLGITNAAFRGQELAEGIFGAQLRLFRVMARDAQTDLPVFDSQHVEPLQAPPGWQPRFRSELAVPLYGRIWQLDITGTPQYEQGLISRSHDLVLVMGLASALVVGLLAGGFVYQRDRQLYTGQQITVRLREQAEQLMLANRYKTEFLANMSHELRTPLNSILILSDQLRQNSAGNLSDKQTRHADIVYRAGSDLLQLINDVLDLAKVEAGRIQLSLEPLNLQDILVDMDAAMRPLAEAKGLHLHIPPINTDSGVPLRAYTDRVRLHQILRNLLSNAIKFTDEGQVHLMVSAGKTLEDGRTVVSFTVRDTGIGIDPSKHAQAFEAFAQLDGSTRRRFGGTGLGLAITRQLVQALEGDIELHSAPGQGSTFTVNLPMQGAAPVEEVQHRAPQRSGEGPPVLLVEDDENFAAVIIEQAHASGFSSVHCMTGQQALELLRTESFAAVILDILLPDLSGWQLFRRLRAQPKHHDTPVHIISCLPQPGGLQAEHDTHYLTKPIGRTALEQIFTSLQQERDASRYPALLLVEDVKTEREHYQQQLRTLGFDVTAVGKAQDARAAWSNGTFDVLVVDLNLPDEDGFTLLDSLDALRPLRGTRVVVNTGLDVNQQGLQRLHGYSAVVVRKQGADTEMLGQAVHGFLGQVASPATGAAVATQQPTLKGRRLLLVDDDIRNVYAMSALLDDFGLHISTAGNGEEAIACYQKEPLDLILMDMSMPVMDGYTATNLLKTQHGCSVPIIALTAHAMKGDREKCLAAGADDYMAKPVQREDLQALLERWLLASEGSEGQAS